MALHAAAILPKHVAIVMDGNGRWAHARNLPRVVGHRAGAQVVRKLVEYSIERGLSVLTLFAFSMENQGRPSTEIQALMALFLRSLRDNVPDLHKNNVRFRVMGDRSLWTDKMRDMVESAELLTQANTGLTLVIAVYYSGRWDICQAACQVACLLERGELTSSQVTEAVLASQLSLSDLPPPDLFIRTSGEQRLSNFMLWQMAYTELFFTSVFWPDFNPDVLEEALTFFATRERRFGLTSQQRVENHV